MWRSLAGLVGHAGPLDRRAIGRLTRHSLVRRLEPQAFDPDKAPWNRRLRLASTNGPVSFELTERQLPDHLPPGWRVEAGNGSKLTVTSSRQRSLASTAKF